MANQLNIQYPPNLPDLLHIYREMFEEEAKMAMAVKLFELKRISSGTAAAMVGCDRAKRSGIVFSMGEALDRMQTKGIYLSRTVVGFALSQVEKPR